MSARVDAAAHRLNQLRELRLTEDQLRDWRCRPTSAIRRVAISRLRLKAERLRRELGL